MENFSKILITIANKLAFLEAPEKNWNWELNNPQLKLATFKTPENQTISIFFRFDREFDAWEISFTSETIQKPKKGKNKNYFDLTSKGEEFYIFRRLIAICKEFIANEDPKRILILADKTNRLNLYLKFIKRLFLEPQFANRYEILHWGEDFNHHIIISKKLIYR